MKYRSNNAKGLLFGAMAIAIAIPRCSCDTNEGIQRAAVEMVLTYVEVDSCSNAAIPRRIPDDYERTMTRAFADFGSRSTKRIEVRSTGTAPLTVISAELSAADPEFTVSVFLGDGTTPAELPMQLAANKATNAPPALVIAVDYSSSDAEPDDIELIVKSDDPQRQEVRFGLTAGNGKLEVCGTNGCVADARVDFGNVSLGQEGTQTVTIKNTGTGDLDLHSLKLESSSAEFCAREVTELPPGVSDCPMVQLCRVLKPGEEYVINVRYLPRDGGNDTGVITIVSGDPSRGNVEVPINAVGAGPAVCPCVWDGTTCTPSPVVDFGGVDVGGSGSRVVRLMSCGTDVVTIDEAVLETATGPFMTGPEFMITQSFNTGTFMPGEYSEGTIEYRPTTGGDHRGGLRYSISQAQSRSWIALVGQAATCELAVLPATLNFGTVGGGASSDLDVVIINNGTRECSVSAISDPANGFSLVNKPGLPHQLSSGQLYALTVRYTAPVRPMATEDRSFFEVTSNSGANPVSRVELVAMGGGTAECALDIQPTNNLTIPVMNRQGQLRFGAVNIGYSRTLSITVRNTGSAQCTLQRFTLVTQAPSGEFTVTPSNPLPFAINPSSSATLDVTFAPRGPAASMLGFYGIITNHVDFTVNGPGLAQTDWSIGLNATPTVPTIDVIPDTIDFGLVTWDRPQPPDMRSSCGSTTRVVNVYNSGSGMLDVYSIQIDPSSDPVFLITGVTNGGNAVSSPYMFQVPPGGDATISLRFFPSRISPSAHNGVLVIENSATGMGTPVTVPLNGGGTANAQQTDTFQQLVDNKVDILWVIDNSGSMSEEQQTLANNFGSFIGYADTLGADYQVGIITTDCDTPSHSGKLQDQTGNPANKIVRMSTAPSAQNVFSTNASVGTNGSGDEKGLLAAKMALEPPTRDMENAGFLRDDARLAVIVVTDEEDASPGSVNLYVDFLRNLKGFQNPQLVSLSAIAGDVPNGCATAVAGARYFDAAAQLGGQFESVCNASWTTALQNIGLGVFALRTAWTLSRQADPPTISVRVNGMSVPQNSMNGWTYDQTTNTVTFHGSAVPQAGQTIEIQYGAVCLL